MRTNFKSDSRGGALVAVIIVVTIACIAAALVVRHGVLKRQNAENDQTVAMLREANQSIKQQLGAALTDRVESGEAMDANFIQGRLATIDAQMKSQYSNVKSVYIAADAPGAISVDLGANLLGPNDRQDPADAFRFFTGTYAPLTSGPLYKVEIGYRPTASLSAGSSPQDRQAAEFIHGYQTSYQTQIEGRVLSPENIGWGHYAPEYFAGEGGKPVVNQSAIIDLDSWAKAPVYIAPPSYVRDAIAAGSSTEAKVRIGGYRSSSVFLNSAMVAHANEATLLNYSGIKAVFARKGFAGDMPISLTELGQNSHLSKLSKGDMLSSARASGAGSLAAIAASETTNQVGTTTPYQSALTDSSSAAFLSRFIFTEGQLGNQKLALVSDRGTQEASGYRLDGRDFWSTAHSTQDAVPASAFTPASRASVRVDLEAIVDGSVAKPRITGVFAMSTGMQLPADNWSIVTGGITYRPGQPEFWAGYAEHLTYDEGTGTIAPLSTLVISGANSVTDRLAASVASRRKLADLVRDFCPQQNILRGYDVVVMNGTDLQSYLGGAIALLKLPLQAGMYPHGAVVVDVSLMDANFPLFAPATGAKDAGVQYRGVFVDVHTPDMENAEKRTVYRDMLNGALILKARDYVDPDINGTPGWGTSRIYRASAGAAGTPELVAGRVRLSHYTAKFPRTDVTYVLGTNGRITFDTSINLNLGTQIGDNGELISTAALSDTTEALRSDLDAFYGNPARGGVPYVSRVSNPASQFGSHRAIFASRIRPALACFITPPATGAGPMRGADPTITNDALLFDVTSGVVSPTVSRRVLMRAPMPFAYPVNGYAASKLLKKFQTLLVTTPIYDGIKVGEDGSVLGAKPARWDERENHITDELTAYTASYIRANVSQPSNPLYSSALAARFDSSDPVVQSFAADLLNPASAGSMVTNLGRREDEAFVRLVFQRYGMSADYNDTYTVHGTYNFRVQMTGNIKEEIFRDCRVDGVLTEQLFRPLQPAVVTLPDGSLRNYTFANCPLPGMVSVTPNAAVSPAQDTTLTGEIIPVALRSYSFFHPAARASEEGPASVAAAVAAYLAPGETRSLGAVMESATKLAPGSYMTDLGAISNTTLQAALHARGESFLRNASLTMRSGSSNWDSMLSMSPFFGAIEYILADSLDDESWVAALPQDHRIYGAWQVDPGMRIVQMRILQYLNGTQISGHRTDLNLAASEISQNEMGTMTSALDGQAETMLGAEMQLRMASPSAIAALTAACLPQLVMELPASQMDGEIGGRIKFSGPRSLADLSPAKGWGLFVGPFGHTLVNGKADLNRTIPQTLEVGVTQVAWTPQYAVTVKGSHVPVRLSPSVDRDRAITATVYEVDSPNAVEMLNTTTGLGIDENGNSVLSMEMERALVVRGITFKLATSVTFNDAASALLTGFDFTGAGTIFTAADSPHPTLTPNIFMRTGATLSDSDIFAWHGSIKSGIGQELPTAIAEALGAKPNYDVNRPITYIYGDPLLTSTAWGRISTVSETPTAAQARDFNKVQRVR